MLTLLLVSFQGFVIRKTNSVAIKADMLHYRSDLLLNGGVLLALVLAGRGWFWADGLFAILIGLFLLVGAPSISAMSRCRRCSIVSCQPKEQARIMALCCDVEGVHGVHDLRTRQSGPTRFVQLHLELDDQLPLVKAHQIADEAELAVRQEFERMDVIIHMDPHLCGAQGTARHSIRTTVGCNMDDLVAKTWQKIEREAACMVTEEPMLASFFHSTILNHKNLRSALSFQLANKLDSATMPAIALREVIELAFAQRARVAGGSGGRHLRRAGA